MRSRWIGLLVFLSFTAISFSLAPKHFPNLGGSSAWGDDDGTLPFPKNATFTTLITTPRGIEGLTGDNQGNLYTGGWGTSPCPVWRINLQKPSRVTVGRIVPSAGDCILLGIAFNEFGDLFVADPIAEVVYAFHPDANNPPTAAVFVSGVPGANSMAFDKKGNLWLTDGGTGKGRVWKITSPGANCTSMPAINCEEAFRVQPMANEANLNASGVGGVGRDVRVLPQGAITVTPISRNAADTLASQPLVANGIAFDKTGNSLFIADTARGAIWKATFGHEGDLKSKTGCDTTFTPNTLCLDNVFIAHPYLESADGIALDQGENIWVSLPERQAIAVVTKNGKVVEVFRNPVNLSTVVYGQGLRNRGEQSVGNNHVLESPTVPFLIGKVLCTAQDDTGRRDNSPRRDGEVSGGQPQDGPIPLAKISCMDQELTIPGLPLPIK